MTCFIICYDTENNDEKILDVIQSYKPNAQIFKNTWAVITDDVATDIRDKLKKVLNQTDRIFVIRSGEEAGWANVLCEKSWLHQY